MTLLGPVKDAGPYYQLLAKWVYVLGLSHRCLHSYLPDEVTFVANPEDFATLEAGTLCTKPRVGEM